MTGGRLDPNPGPRDGAAGRDFTGASRDALAEALLAAGPDQPTLCAGWRTQHLAAHIVLRESSPLGAGLVIGPLHRALERRTLDLGDSASSPAAFQDLVERISTGPTPPPRIRRSARAAAVSEAIRSSKTARRAAQATNLLEFFVHTEDVRRAQDRWAPRHLAGDYADALYTELARRARMLYRGEPTGIVLARSTGGRLPARTARRGQPTRTISGPAGELVMHAFGRRDRALVVDD